MTVDPITDALMEPGNAGVLDLSLSDVVPAYEFSAVLQALDELYFGHLWLTIAEGAPIGVPAPDPYSPTPAERLYISRSVIGTPNLLELVGRAPYLTPVAKTIGTILGGAKSRAIVEPGSVPGVQVPTQIERPLSELTTLELAERAHVLFLAQKISAEQRAHKEASEQHARNILQSFLPELVKDVTYRVVGH